MLTALDRLDGMEAALLGLADALASGQPDAVLAAEVPISAAVAQLTALAQRPSALADTAAHEAALDPIHLRAAIGRVRAAIGLCERLGATADDLVRTLMPAPYGASGFCRPLADVRPLTLSRH